MLSNLPLSYFFEFADVDEELRKLYFAEFASYNVKHLVLSAALLNMMVAKRELMKKIPQEMAEFGLSFADGHLPYSEYCNFNCVFANEIPSLILRHKLHINIAALLGVKTLTFHLGNDYSYPDIPLEKHLDNACRMIEALLPEAERCGVILAMENIHVRPSQVEIITGIVKKFDSPHLGLCFDCGHANLMDKGRLYENSEAERFWRGKNQWASGAIWVDTEYIRENMKPYIVNCHLHDNTGEIDQHTIPGRGNIDWQSTLKFLSEAPRLQVMQSEVQMFRNSLAVKETVESFQRIFVDFKESEK